MKRNSTTRQQKVATLSSVFIITTICRFNVGMNRNSLISLSSLNVLSTEIPEESASLRISKTLTATMAASNRLRGSLMYPNTPKPKTLSSISMKKTTVNIRLETSTILVNRSGCWWYSMPMKIELTRMAPRIAF